MINMGELFAYPRLFDPDMERVKLSEDEKATFNVLPLDLLFARQSLVAEGAGKCCIALKVEVPTTFESHLIRVRLDPSQCDPLFYFYFFKSGTGYGAIQTLVNQVSAAGIRGSDLAKLKVLYPPLDVQKKAAAILSAYDDLIENNQQRIALLEAIAEELYREWFVRLRFAGYGKVKVIKGVPEGWSFDKGATFFGLVKGKSYAGEELTEDTEHMPFVNLKSFNRGGGYREDGLKYYSGRYKPEQVVRQNDVVMAVTDMTQDRAVVGRVARMPNLGKKGAVISLDTVKLVPKNINKTFLYAYMRHSGFANFIKEFANGANVLHLKPDLIPQQKIVIPTEQLQNRFAEIVEPIYAEIDALGESNGHLMKMRDALLPRLVSAKLSVSNLDIRFPPSMVERVGP
ncbi:MAG: restriction endonuclease subunit S [Burkholderiaceae bacterium]|nr:restriction endonuclease subunit S [Burkholderiaceae bacterium]